ncbi:hypothetical protein ACFVUS_29505 [Nocardia sp. NPDC058058]|uniref:hypothetical protein n=1 Tax=Nocardia sp. NPDC058058 TaxID=3346317 RepID=UPI0036DB3BDA
MTKVPDGLPCQVIGKLQATAWRVIVGVGNGHLDGGVHQDWLDEDMPREIRRPNAFFYITTDYSE